jgi:hypothetical protein
MEVTTPPVQFQAQHIGKGDAAAGLRQNGNSKVDIQVRVIDGIESPAPKASVGWEARRDLGGGGLAYQQGEREQECNAQWIPAFAGMTGASCHSRESGGPWLPDWIPAFAGMTLKTTP